MAEKILEIKELSASLGKSQLLSNINLTICKGEHWLINGESGSGKTSLAHAIIGRLFHSGTSERYTTGAIALVEQQHRFRTLSNTHDFYYQQRFQSQDAEDSLTIAQELEGYFSEDGERVIRLLKLMRLENLLDEPMIQLSNGENKRLQLIKILLSNPSILILDNPFIGLDVEGRKLLRDIIDQIAGEGIHIILISAAHELPNCITHIAKLKQGRLIFSGPKDSFTLRRGDKVTVDPGIDISSLVKVAHPFFEVAVRMKNVTIRYGDHVILDNINWLIKKGECWSLSGPNGAGKSTLLSLINADNPQAYANEIYLFDKRKGRGESIWDIKRNIGFVSPEMHLYFPYVSTCFEVIASGLFDTVGLFRAVSDEQEEQVNKWITLFELRDISEKPLHQLSISQQRMSLLARALVKNPALLILDEPCQGLDNLQIAYFNKLIDQLCRQFGTTLIYVSHYKEQLPDCIDRHFELGKTSGI